MFYDTKIELMLRLGKCFKIGTIEEAEEDFTKDLHHFDNSDEVDEFRIEVDEKFSMNGITDIHEALKCYDV